MVEAALRLAQAKRPAHGMILDPGNTGSSETAPSQPVAMNLYPPHKAGACFGTVISTTVPPASTHARSFFSSGGQAPGKTDDRAGRLQGETFHRRNGKTRSLQEQRNPLIPILAGASRVIEGHPFSYGCGIAKSKQDNKNNNEEQPENTL